MLVGLVAAVWLFTCFCHRPRQAPLPPDSLSTPLNGVMANPSTARLPLFDNAKALLVFVVICAHTDFSVGHDHRGVDGFTSFGFMWVMPGFAFISGHVSSSTMNRKRAVAIFGMLSEPSSSMSACPPLLALKYNAPKTVARSLKVRSLRSQPCFSSSSSCTGSK